MITATTTGLTNWISPSTTRALAWALLHFLWQGTALAALAAVLHLLTPRARVRHTIGVGVLGLMLLAPFVTFLLLSRQPPIPKTVQPKAAVLAPLNAVAKTANSTFSSSVAMSRDALPWLVEAWLLGVAIFGLRYAGGFFLIERERRKRSAVVEDRVLEICRSLQAQLGIERAIQYCEGVWLQAPAVIGWFKPIVFLPASALTGLSEDQLRSVIAHELAHIQRLDPFVNIFQVCVETVLFYHPAVWWLNKRIRAEREVCCDETAVLLCGNAVDYARALTMMEEWRGAPVLAMAANRGPLTERILRVLGLKTFGNGIRGVGLTGSVLCMAAALVAGNALLGIAHPKAAFAATHLQMIPKPLIAAVQAAAASIQAPKPSPTHQHPSDTSAGSYIDEMKAAGLGDLTVDQLIELKSQDVTSEYVRGLKDQGMHVDVDSLIAMRVQGVTPEYIKEMRAAGLNPDQNQIVALKVQDADANYYRSLKEAGVDPDLNHLIAMKVQDVTPEYVRELRAAGLATTPDQVIAMKVQDVTPAYAQQMRSLGLEVSGNELLAMKVQDVTPEWIKQIQSLGLKPTANELISMRVQDVTPEYIKALQSAGFKVGVNDIISAKVQDVTPEFIERVKQHGFKDLTLEKVIRLRELGVLDSKADL